MENLYSLQEDSKEVNQQFNVPIIGEGMKHETEINHLKNLIKKLALDIADFGSLLIQAGIVEVKEEDGNLVYKVNKVKIDEALGGEPQL